VDAVIGWVVADGRAAHDPFEGITRSGLDEISYERGHRCPTIRVDHTSGRRIWAAVSRDKGPSTAFSTSCARSTVRE